MDVEKEAYAQNKLIDEGTSKAAENDFSKDGQVLPRRSQRSTKGVPPARFGLDDNVGASEATHVAFHAASKGNLQLQYCNTKEMVTDIFAKPICRSQFLYLHSKLGMRENTASSTVD